MSFNKWYSEMTVKVLAIMSRSAMFSWQQIFKGYGPLEFKDQKYYEVSRLNVCFKLQNFIFKGKCYFQH